MIGFRNPKCYLTKLLDFVQNVNVSDSDFEKRKFYKLVNYFWNYEALTIWYFNRKQFSKIPVNQLKQDLVPRYWYAI